MEQKAVIKLCKNLGCCNSCCIRYIGVKNPNAYGNSQEYIGKHLDPPNADTNNPEASKNQIKTEEDITDVDSNEKSLEEDKDSVKTESTQADTKIEVKTEENGSTEVPGKQNSNGDGSPPAKRIKTEICLSCLGILQETTWSQSFETVKEQLDKKRYDCDSFACALSAPIATLVREKAITLHLKNSFPDYDTNVLTPLKEAWKWSFGVKLESHINKTLISGSTSPLLITVVMEYPDDSQELEIVKVLSPDLFESRRQQRKRFTVELTRRSVEQALDGASFEELEKLDWKPAPVVRVAAHCASVTCTHVPHYLGGSTATFRLHQIVKALCVEQALDGASFEALEKLDWKPAPVVRVAPHCASVACNHVPQYLGGRYIKLSRELPQTPWLVSGRRMMESSVQEIIFEPLAKLMQMPAEEVECRMKFMSAGREDVDVRCLGEGRPFAIEVADPRRLLTAEELKKACEEMSSGGKAIVKELIYVTKDDLTLLKKGEETKTKTYEALCIKLTHTEKEKEKLTDKDKDTKPVVTEQDIAKINSYRNTDDTDARITLQQKTPIRVLHRRPLLTRTRRILDLEAKQIPDQPQLFWVRLVTEAGTYVKEWAHGELGRTDPSLCTALGARTDILALDVAAVDLPWPHTKPNKV